MKLWKIAVAAVGFVWVLTLFHVQMSPMAIRHNWYLLLHQFDSNRRPPKTAIEMRDEMLARLPGQLSPIATIKKRLSTESDITIYFATERAKLSGSNTFFSKARDPEKRVTYGVIKINVPAAAYGRLDNLRPIVDIGMPAAMRNPQATILTAEEFYNQLFKGKTDNPLDVAWLPGPVIYIHGFNNTLPEELWRAAKLKRDGAVAEPIIIFDWPSYGSVWDYSRDRAAIENSADTLADFMEAIHAKCGGRKINILAHSMGSRITLRSLRLLSDRKSPTKVKQLVFVAPDVDDDFFRSQLEKVEDSGTVDKIVVYGSETDAALLASRRHNHYEPVGLFPVHSWVSNMSAIDVTGVPLTPLGHGYFGSSLEVEVDLGCVFNGALCSTGRKFVKDISTPGLLHLEPREFHPNDEEY